MSVPWLEPGGAGKYKPSVLGVPLGFALGTSVNLMLVFPCTPLLSSKYRLSTVQNKAVQYCTVKSSAILYSVHYRTVQYCTVYSIEQCSNVEAWDQRPIWLQSANTIKTQHSIALPCPVLHCTALPFTLPHYTALHCTTLHYTTLLCTELQYTALHYTTLHCYELHYSDIRQPTLHCNALHFSTLYWPILHCNSRKYCIHQSTTFQCFTHWFLDLQKRKQQKNILKCNYSIWKYIELLKEPFLNVF